MRRRKIYALIVALVVLSPVLFFWIRGYRLVFFTSSLFKGEARLEDRGPFSTRPRYIIRFQEISLAAPGRYEYHCKGLPWETMTFGLKVLDHRKREELVEEVGEVQVDFRLTDGKQTPVRTFKGPLKQWILSGIGDVADEFWHFQTRDIAFKPDVAYMITIIVENVPANNSLKLEPRIEGGGYELP